MSEFDKRIPLDDDTLEAVAGGNVLYVCNAVDHYCWGSHNPDKKYEFQSKRKMLDFISKNYDYYGEGGIFQAMIDEGLITPMN